MLQFSIVYLNYSWKKYLETTYFFIEYLQIVHFYLNKQRRYIRWIIVYVSPGGVGGGGVKGAPLQEDKTVPWRARRQVAGKVLCALRFGVHPPERKRKKGRNGAWCPSYWKWWRSMPSSHWGWFTLMRDDRTLASHIQWWLAFTIVTPNLLFTYLQVHAYASFCIFTRCLVMPLSVASASTLRRPSTKSTKVVKC